MKRTSRWIEVDFESASQEQTASKIAPQNGSTRSHKLQEPSRNNRPKVNNSKRIDWFHSLWFESLKPTYTDLCIHPKKLKECLALFENLLYDTGKIIVLKGPSGCGKSATFSAIAEKLSLSVKTFRVASSGCEMFSDTEITDESELQEFKTFLSASCSSPISLKKEADSILSSEKQVLWVPQLPNVFLLHFHKLELLMELFVVSSMSCPVVFEITECNTSSAVGFSSKFVMLNGVEVVSFNPIANSFLSKGLQSLCNALPVSLRSKFKTNFVKNVLEASSGDMRQAINLVQFLLLSDKPGVDLHVKDHSLGFFHAIGKVLNPKRSPVKSSMFCDKCKVNSLTTDLSEVLQTIDSVGHQFFLSIVEENFIHHCDFPSLASVSRTIDDFLLCDILHAGEFYLISSSGSTFSNCTKFICCTSVLFWLSQRPESRTSRGFAPIKKPEFSCKKQVAPSSEDRNYLHSKKSAFEVNGYIELMSQYQKPASFLQGKTEDSDLQLIFNNSVQIEDYDSYSCLCPKHLFALIKFKSFLV